jgi:hypothetical protein
MLLTYRKTIAVDLIYHDANKLCPPQKLPPSATEVALTMVDQVVAPTMVDDPTTVPTTMVAPTTVPTTVDQVVAPTAVPTTEVDNPSATVCTDDSSMDDDAAPHTPTRSDGSSGNAVQTDDDGNSRKRGADKPHTTTRSDGSSGNAVQTDDDGNSHKRGADNSMLFEESIPPVKRASRQRPVAIAAVRHTKLPTPQSKLYQSICVDNTYAE